MNIDGKVSNKELLSKAQGYHNNYRSQILKAHTRIRNYLNKNYPLDNTDSFSREAYVRLYSLDHNSLEKDIRLVLISTKFLSYSDVTRFELEFDVQLVKICLENKNILGEFKPDSSFDSLFNPEDVFFFYHFRRLNDTII